MTPHRWFSRNFPRNPIWQLRRAFRRRRESGLRLTFRALRHRNFRLFITGQIVSLVGTWMQNVAQAWLVYRLTHSELLLGTAWFCTQIPVFALGPLGGLAADRFSRHKLVIVTQTLSMFQAFALAALTLSGKVQVWHVLALAVVLGTINAFDMPGRQSLVIQMTSKDDLLNAISLNSAMFNAARVVGPAIAGTAGGGGRRRHLLPAERRQLSGRDRLPAGHAAAAVHAARVPDSPWAHLVDGLPLRAGNRAVRRLLGMMAATPSAGMPALVLMPFFADDIFHRGSRGLGIPDGRHGRRGGGRHAGAGGRTRSPDCRKVIF